MPRQAPAPRVELFLDSGAFSAYTQGITIDLNEYIAFIKTHLSILSVYANLDVIGDPVATLANQSKMEAAGLKPLPCYHYGEDPKYLLHYMETHDYIALGGMAADSSGAPLSNAIRSAWLDRIYTSYICGPDGMPKVKVHGFGLTSLKLMCRYPWYSVDSTSWVVTGRMGSVYVPKPWAGSLDDPWKVCVSTRSPNKTEAGKHLDSFPVTQRQHVLDYFAAKGYKLGRSEFRQESAGYVPKEGERPMGKIKAGALAEDQEVEVLIELGLCNDYRMRDELNIIYFLDLEKAMPEWPWAFKLARLRGGFGL